MRTSLPWHLFTNRHPERNGDPWGVIEAIRHPAGGAGQMPSGMSITWTGPIGRDNAAFIVEACNNYESVCAERDRLKACLAFFASVIKSGEPWTETCEREYRTALSTPPTSERE